MEVWGSYGGVEVGVGVGGGVVWGGSEGLGDWDEI